MQVEIYYQVDLNVSRVKKNIGRSEKSGNANLRSALKFASSTYLTFATICDYRPLTCNIKKRESNVTTTTIVTEIPTYRDTNGTIQINSNPKASSLTVGWDFCYFFKIARNKLNFIHLPPSRKLSMKILCNFCYKLKQSRSMWISQSKAIM